MPGSKRPGKQPPTRVTSLTDGERRRLRASVKNLHLKWGTWAALASALEVPKPTLMGIAYGTDYGSVEFAAKVATIAGIPLRALLDGRVGPADRCPECGQLLPEEDGGPTNT